MCNMKNVTIALDEKLIRAGREYARKHHTSLNNVIRGLLERTVVPRKGGGGWDLFFALGDSAEGDSRGRRWAREDLYDV